VRVENGLVVTTRGDRVLRADAHVPVGPGPFPGVLLVHGGAWHGGTRLEMHRPAMRLARHGYTAVSVDYRLAPTAEFPAPLEDVREALGWMRRRAPELRLDPDRVAAWGYSAGAQLVALLALEPASRLRAAVVGGTPSDLVAFDNAVVRSYLGAAPDEAPERYERASPARRVAAPAPPFLVYHGRRDWIVPFAQGRLLAERLAAAGIPCEVAWRPGGHVDTQHDDDEITRIALRFLDRWLRDGAPAERGSQGCGSPDTEEAGPGG
jgi:acetyl esterase/lipase